MGFEHMRGKTYRQMGTTMLRPITRVVKNVIYTLTWHYRHGFIG